MSDDIRTKVAKATAIASIYRMTVGGVREPREDVVKRVEDNWKHWSAHWLEAADAAIEMCKELQWQSTETASYDLYTVTPSGYAARILSTNGPKDAPIVALLRIREQGETIMCFNREGESATGHKLTRVNRGTDQ